MSGVVPCACAAPKRYDATTVEPGHVLFNEDDTGDLMYAVVEGQVTLSRGGVSVEEVGPGGILGELALIDHVNRSATATTAVESKIVPVDKKAFRFLVQEHPTFALMVMNVMAERLRRANERS